MTSLGRKFGTALPEHQMSVSLPSQVQSSRSVTKLLCWWNCSGLFTTIPEMQDEGLSNIWMCSEAAKALSFVRHTDYSPFPVALLVSTHRNKLHGAGSGTQSSKVFQSLAQFWLQSVNIEPEIPPCEDLAASLETALVVGTLLWRIRDTATGRKNHYLSGFFLFIMDKVTTNLGSCWFNILTSDSAIVKRR